MLGSFVCTYTTYLLATEAKHPSSIWLHLELDSLNPLSTALNLGCNLIHLRFDSSVSISTSL